MNLPPQACKPVEDRVSGETPVDCRLPRERRLNRSGYRAVFDGGHRWAGRYLVIWMLRSSGDSGRRLGIVASKRSFRRAVDRNRARRRMREVFRCHQTNLVGGVALVLVARHTLQHASLAAIVTDYRMACRRLGIWNDGKC